MARKPLSELAVNYAAPGVTRAADVLSFPPAGFRAARHRARIGHGPARWDWASQALLSWGVKTASGFGVEPDAVGGPARGVETVYGSNGVPMLSAGDSVWLVAHWGPFHWAEPVRVIYLIDEPDRVGFAYGTLPGHPLAGEERFEVSRTDDDSVWITVTTVSRPATAGWMVLAPVLRLAQSRLRRRYLRALAGPLE